MANKIQETKINPKTFVTASSRYADSKVLYYGDLNKLTFTIYKRSSELESKDDKFMVIPPGMSYRPDRVSKAMYGTVDFWWRILEMNGMKDILEFKAGTNVRLPASLLKL